MNNFQLGDSGPTIIQKKPPRPSFAQKLVSWGIVQNEQQGNMVLIGLIVVCFLAIIIINARTFSTPSVPVDDFDEFDDVLLEAGL